MMAYTTEDYERDMATREKIEFKDEKGLCAWFERWLKDTGWEVYKEVSTRNGYCDFVAVREIDGEEVRWGVEAKMSCSADVIRQAENNLGLFNAVSIVTPFEPNYIFEKHMRDLGIGCIQIQKTVRYSTNYYKFFEERPHDVKNLTSERSPVEGLWVPGNWGVHIEMTAKRRQIKSDNSYELHDLYKNEDAGVTGVEKLTPYKLSVMKILDYAQEKGGWVDVTSMINEIGDTLHWHDVRAGVRNACGKWETDRFDTKMEKRKYYIRAKDEV